MSDATEQGIRPDQLPGVPGDRHAAASNLSGPEHPTDETHAAVGRSHYETGHRLVPDASHETKHTVGATINGIRGLWQAAPELARLGMQALGRQVDNYLLDSIAMSQGLIASQNHRMQTMIGHAIRANNATSAFWESVESHILYGDYRNWTTDRQIGAAKRGEKKAVSKIGALDARGVPIPETSDAPSPIAHEQSAKGIRTDSKDQGQAFRWVLQRDGMGRRIEALEETKRSLQRKRAAHGTIREGIRGLQARVQARVEARGATAAGPRA